MLQSSHTPSESAFIDEKLFLIDKATKKPIPLKRCNFEVTLQQGFADMIIHQVYHNEGETPLETLFMMPYTDTFTVHGLEANFHLEDGTSR
jgi:hypothetical protein